MTVWVGLGFQPLCHPERSRRVSCRPLPISEICCAELFIGHCE